MIDAWREREPKADGLEYLFLDEAQFIRRNGQQLGTWVKHQVDFRKEQRIARGYVVTKSLDDFGPMQGLPPSPPGAETPATQVMRMPAPLLCYWMSATELPQGQ